MDPYERNTPWLGAIGAVYDKLSTFTLSPIKQSDMYIISKAMSLYTMEYCNIYTFIKALFLQRFSTSNAGRVHTGMAVISNKIRL